MTLNHECRDFRDKLTRALEGLPMPTELATLSWHEHLLGCGNCRTLLEREEALEVLLATLPEPKLPPDLTRRLVARLANYEDSAQGKKSGSATEPSLYALGLDDLLEIAGAPVPEGLSTRVRAGLRAERALDALLDLDSEIEIPRGLTAGVLRGLAKNRRRSVPLLRILRSMPVYAAAAGILLAALGISLWNGGFGTGSNGNENEELASSNASADTTAELSEPDPSLLAVLDIIESDCLWTDTETGAEVVTEESDLYLLLSDSIDTSDEILLTFLEEEGNETESTSDG